MRASLIKPPLRLKQILVLAITAYVLAVGLRLGEAPRWDSPDYRLDGEYILATHDSYHWLAGALGFEFGQEHPMSRFLAGLHALTGAPLGNIGLWLPPFTASLVAAVMVVWAAALGARCSGVVTGLLACFAPGFLARTLMGFCDTDLVTLLFSLLLGLVPALWLRPWVQTPLARLACCPALGERAPPSASERVLSWPWLAALALCGWFGHWTQLWHSLFSYLTLWYALAIPGCIALFVPRSSPAKPALLRGVAVYMLPLLFGGWGALGAAIIAWRLRAGKAARGLFWSRSGLALLWALLLALLVLLCLDKGIVQACLRLLGSYLKDNPVGQAAGLVYPGVAQSIIEIQDLSSTKELLNYFYPAWQLSLLGIVGFAVLAVLSPLALLHAPLLVLALLSVKLGGRMAMFGVPAVALGLTLPFSWLVDYVLYYGCFARLRQRFAQPFPRLRKWAFRIPWADCLLVVLLAPYLTLAPRISLGPIMQAEQARALREIAEITPPNAVIWVWWDFGYATQYFAQRRTIADGARHGGAHLYLPAAVYSSADPLFAEQLILHAASLETPEGGESTDAAEMPALTPDRAGGVFKGLSPEEAQALVDGWRSATLKATAEQEPQYLVVSFDILRLGYWISKYGNWNFVEADGEGYNISAVSRALKYNVDQGKVSVEGREPVEADSLDILSPDGLARYSYYRYNDRHFIFNLLSGDKLILSDALYNSLMAQLLLSPPDDPRFTPFFELVFDNGYCRVYKVK